MEQEGSLSLCMAQSSQRSPSLCLHREGLPSMLPLRRAITRAATTLRLPSDAHDSTRSASPTPTQSCEEPDKPLLVEGQRGEYWDAVETNFEFLFVPRGEDQGNMGTGVPRTRTWMRGTTDSASDEGRPKAEGPEGGAGYHSICFMHIDTGGVT